jgi:DNA (cytosine-5)-methyltransferase 1
MTALADRVSNLEIEAPGVLVGGTPCQAFSVAGLRQSLDDDRGQLTIKFLELANAIDTVRRSRGEPECIVVWENVPGVLSTKDNALGCFLAGLAGESEPLLPAGGRWSDAGCVYGPERTIAWRVLDAQYFGVAQRRRRLFVVASAREGFDPAQVLFEFDGLRRDIAPSREAGQEAAKCLTAGVGKRYDFETETLPIGFGSQMSNPQTNVDLMQTLNAKNPMAVAQPVAYRKVAFGEYADDNTASTMAARDFKSATDLAVQPTPYRVTFCDANGRRQDRPNGGLYVTQPDVSGTLTGAESDLKILQPISFSRNDFGGDSQINLSPTMRVAGNAEGMLAVCFQQNTRDEVRLIGGEGNLAGALAASAGMKQTNYIAQPIPINSMNAFRSPDADKSTGCGIGEEGEAMFTLTKANHHAVAAAAAIGFTRCDHGGDAVLNGTPTMRCGSNYSAHLAAAIGWSEELTAHTELQGTLQRGGDGGRHEGVMQPDMQVRRLTPVECERLQGFPDGYTLVPHRGKPAADGPRYKSLGNSMAVPVMAWIGRRIDQETKPRETT